MNWEEKNILVVDDVKINYAVLRGMLKSTRATILWAKNYPEALTHFKENEINLILMDYQMPDMDGLEMSKRIKAVFENLPIIFQTANTNDIAGIENEKYYEEVIEKPINRNKLLYTIEKYLMKK
ncbi:MAG: response regulator [Bacteroidota bacterium]|nr:response regulator [Bacteroidota bacterium]